MELLLVLALIFWVLSAVGKSKKRQQQEQAAQARARAAAAAARQAEAGQNAAQQAQPLQPTVQPTLSPRLETPDGRRHTLESSQKTGHAHMETSMTGIAPECPPVLPRAAAQPPLSDRLAAFKAQKRATARPVPAEEAPAVVDLEQKQEAFRFDMARVRDGIVYAEILSPPKALRRGRI